jgi:hypothetical protein
LALGFECAGYGRVGAGKVTGAPAIKRLNTKLD